MGYEKKHSIQIDRYQNQFSPDKNIPVDNESRESLGDHDPYIAFRNNGSDVYLTTVAAREDTLRSAPAVGDGNSSRTFELRMWIML